MKFSEQRIDLKHLHPEELCRHEIDLGLNVLLAQIITFEIRAPGCQLIQDDDL